jgi:L-fuconolactonase
MHVDSHTHLVSLDEERYPLNPMSMTGPWYHEEPCPAERMLDLGDQTGVDGVVVVQAFSAYQYDNRYAADVARRYPERFTSVAIVDLAAPDPAGELRRLVVKEGMRGLRWWGLASPSVAEPRSVWDTAAELGIPVVMTVLADRLVELADALPSLPPVPVALDHCGFSDFADGIPDALSALAAFPNLSLKVSTHTLDEMAKHGDAAEGVAELAASFGADRMMWGSDYPQTHDRPYSELVEWGRRGAGRLDDAGRAAFLGGTALRYWPELAA